MKFVSKYFRMAKGKKKLDDLFEDLASVEASDLHIKAGQIFVIWDDLTDVKTTRNHIKITLPYWRI